MKHIKILLVEDNNLEVLNIQRELTSNNVNFTMHVAQTGLDALAILMGCSSPRLENYSKTGKVQPDIMLVDIDSSCMNVAELLGIMRKYYSLQQIKVFIMGTAVENFDATGIEKTAISGYISKPFSLRTKGANWDAFRENLGVNAQKAWLPLLTLIPELQRTDVITTAAKIKSFFMQSYGAFVFKVAAGCLTAAVITTAAGAAGHQSPKKTNVKHTGAVRQACQALQIPPASPAIDSCPADHALPAKGPVKRKTANVSAKTVVVKNLPGEPVREKREFRIRVIAEGE